MPIHGIGNVKLAITNTVGVANDDLRGVYLSGLKNIVQETPADKGRARNNWFLSVGVPSIKTTTSASIGGGGSLSQASKMPKDVLNNKIFFSNNLPYIGILEYGGFPNPVKKGSYIKGKYQKLSSMGYSEQVLELNNAPVGWVRANLVVMQNKIRSL